MKERTESELLHRMAAYCSSAERCRRDIEEKLAFYELPDEAIARIIKRLTDEKFLDEVRFAGSFANDKLRFNKWGKAKIKNELMRKEISRTTVENALSAIDETLYEDTILSLIKAKRKTVKGKNEYEINQKLIRFLFGKGFTLKEACSALAGLGETIFTDSHEGTGDME